MTNTFTILSAIIALSFSVTAGASGPDRYDQKAMKKVCEAQADLAHKNDNKNPDPVYTSVSLVEDYEYETDRPIWVCFTEKRISVDLQMAVNQSTLLVDFYNKIASTREGYRSKYQGLAAMCYLDEHYTAVDSNKSGPVFEWVGEVRCQGRDFEKIRSIDLRNLTQDAIQGTGFEFELRGIAMPSGTAIHN